MLKNGNSVLGKLENFPSAMENCFFLWLPCQMRQFRTAVLKLKFCAKFRDCGSSGSVIYYSISLASIPYTGMELGQRHAAIYIFIIQGIFLTFHSCIKHVRLCSVTMASRFLINSFEILNVPSRVRRCGASIYIQVQNCMLLHYFYPVSMVSFAVSINLCSGKHGIYQ